MYLIKLYRGELCSGAYYEDGAMAREGFEQVKSCLGNPLIKFRFSIVLGGEEVGEIIYELGAFDRAELVELVVAGEKVLDSYELKAEEE